MFIKMAALKDAIAEVVEKVVNGPRKNNVVDLEAKITELTNEKKRLKEEVADLEIKKRVEEEEIEHLLKIQKEKAEIERTKWELEKERGYRDKEVELEKKVHDQILTGQKELHNKSMELLKEGKTDLQDIYKKILERLPNVSASFEHKKVSN